MAGPAEVLPPPPPDAPPADIQAEPIAAAEKREEDALVDAGSIQAAAEADRQIREAEHLRAAAEAGATEVTPSAAGPDGEALPGAAELQMSDQQIARRRERDEELRSELERAESRLAATRERTERALEEARSRLEQIEAQERAAQERAARAEALAQARREEADRERRLYEMLDRINEAEQRAREAEARAEEAVAGAAEPASVAEEPPETPAEPASVAEEPPETPAAPAASTSPTDASSIFEPQPPADEPASSPPESKPEPESEAPAWSEAPTSFADIAVGAGGSASEPEPAAGGEVINLNEASFEQLRDAGLSVTQTGRVLAHRERQGGFRSLDELDEIPGFSQDFLDRVKPRLAV